MPGIMLMGEWALKFIWCAWCAWCAWCTWCDWCGWCDWCPFIFPCSSARRTVSACVLPSGITLFSADMASCASSRLLNLCRELFDQLEWIQCVVVCDSKKQMWMFCFFFYLTNATPRGLPVNLSRRIFFCTMMPYLPKIVSKWSSVMVFGRFVTYKLVSRISSPAGRAYETFNRLLRIVIPFRDLMACWAPSSLT